jgi:hypothetical protein
LTETANHHLPHLLWPLHHQCFLLFLRYYVDS